MAYQQVGTPRFFVDHGLWLSSLGLYNPQIQTLNGGEWVDTPSIVQLNPTNQLSFTGNYVSIMVDRYAPINYMAVLGHNVATEGGQIAGYFITEVSTAISEQNVINLDGNAQEYDGFSICTFDDTVCDGVQLNIEGISNVSVGAISIGNTYTMPHSADLRLSISYDYSGTKTIETKGGASLSNTFWSKPPMWGENLAAWELGEHFSEQPLSRSGRKIWDLSFSFLDDGDVFGSNQSLSEYTWENEISGVSFDDGDVTEGGFNYDILSDDNFYSQVIHKTNGGQLPFIFQPNAPILNKTTGLYEGGDNTNFAICKFDQKSFSLQQTAPNLYSVKCKIREVW